MAILRSGCRFLSLVAILFSAVAAVHADDFTADTREAAQSWALHRIAVVQAAAGDVQGAKRTAAQIDRRWDPGPTKVTGVWFRGGQPIYVRTNEIKPLRWESLNSTKPTSQVLPNKVPQGLPADYLDADPRHGAVVGFTDEQDHRGTRVTTRIYADGHVAIETPCRGSAADR